MNDEYDITRKMLKTINSNSILELATPIQNNVNNGVELDSESIDNEDDVIKLSGQELRKERKKFNDTIGDTSLQIKMFNIYPSKKNVVFGGQIPDMDDLEFQFTLEESNGFFITCNNLVLNETILEKLKRMTGFYNGWKSMWWDKINNEYETTGNE